jgi:hypothetical protein
MGHPSFAEIGGDGYRHLNPRGQGNFLGACNPTNQYYHASIKCNNKLIGAWTFAEIAEVGNPYTQEPSPYDEWGHGTHVASIAAGNVVHNVPLGSEKVTMMGVAPHANIIMYDACGLRQSGNYIGSCPTETILMAIEQAVLDGVDVLNFSIHGGRDPWNDPIDLAFLAARQAGIVVSTIAGNLGAPGTVHHASPWVLTAAATTLNRANDQADHMGFLSTRGPNHPTFANIIKPDIAAPGINVLAAWVDDGKYKDYFLGSGTSMAAPNTAGSVALLMGLYPEWSPAEIQSALMLTATPNVYQTDSKEPTTPFDRGSGRIQVAQAASTGLVLNETISNFLQANPLRGGDLRTLNIASMADTACVITCTWTRTFRNTRDSAIEWQVSSNNPKLSATPNKFTIPANGTRTITFTFDASQQTLNTGIHAQVQLSATNGLSPDLRLPVFVVPSTTNMQTWYQYQQTTGTTTINQTIRTHAYNALAIKTFGLVRGTTVQGSILQGQFHVSSVDVTSPADFIIADLRNTNTSQANLLIISDVNNDGRYDGNDQVLCNSEQGFCSITNPTVGNYLIVVRNEKSSAVQVADPFTLNWAILKGDQNNLSITYPNSTTGGDIVLQQKFALNSQAGDSWYGAYSLIDQGTGSIISTSHISYYHIQPTLTVTKGNQQYALLNSNFAIPLQVQLTDGQGQALIGETISFNIPTNGAGATFIGANTAITDAQGFASVRLKANSIEGSYTVQASTASGQSVTFQLSNLTELPNYTQYLPLVYK